MRKSEARVMRVLQNFYLIKESLASFMHVIPKNLLPAQTCWEVDIQIMSYVNVLYALSYIL